MLSERELIGLFAAGRAAAAGRAGDLGIGDDCAVMRVGGRRMLVTIDLMIEGIHFDLAYTSGYFLGRKAVAASLSDIAAMGGVPRAIFVSVALARRKPAAFARALAEGIHEEAEAAGAAVLGGDTSASPGPTWIDVAAVGEASSGGPVLRSGARPGDLIYVSGALGGSARGLELLQAGFRPWSRRAWSRDLSAPEGGGGESRAKLLAALAHLLPRPRLSLGRTLAERRLASAMIDLSDGLSTDLHNLCSASRVGAELRASALPIHESLAWSALGRLGRAGTTGGGARGHGARAGTTAAGARGARENVASPAMGKAAASPTGRALRIALSGGEDYQLLFTVASENEARLERLTPSLDVQVTRIGRIVPARRGVGLVGLDARSRPLPRSGYEHFRRR